MDVGALLPYLLLSVCLSTLKFYILQKTIQVTIQALQEGFCTQRDLNELLQQDNSAASLDSPPDSFLYLQLSKDNFHHLQAEHDQQTNELFLLRKTVEEMGQCIKKQRLTLNSREESSKKLLEMLQEKDLTKSGLPDEEGLSVCCSEEVLRHLEILEKKEKENKHLREVRYG